MPHPFLQKKFPLALLLAAPLIAWQAASAAGCDRTSIQTRLNKGESPLTIYKTCGQSMANLYGQNYKGGLLAYLNLKDGSGLVAAPGNFTGGAFWVNMGTGRGYFSTNAQASAIGTGMANTQQIINASGAPGTSPGTAYNYAAWASKTPLNGYSDWFLPSSDEMVQVFANLPNVAQTCGSTNEAGFWTSTEAVTLSIPNRAYYVDCSGQAKKDLKNTAYGVRLARAFIDKSPSIGSLSQTTVRLGASLTLTGSNFNPTASSDTVIFTGGAKAVASSATATSLTVTVPANAQTGPVVVKADSLQSAPSTSLTVEIVPVLVSVTPSDVFPGDTVTVAGSNFSPVASNNLVMFAGGVNVNPIQATSTTLKVVVPSGANAGIMVVQSNGVSSQMLDHAIDIKYRLVFSNAPERFTSYTLNNFNLTGIFLNNPCTQDCIYVPGRAGAAGRAAFPAGTGTTFKVARSDGIAFELHSMEFSLLNPKVEAQGFLVTGNLAGGGTVTQWVTVPSQTPNTVVSFPASFNNLTSVTWDPQYSTLKSVTASMVEL